MFAEEEAADLTLKQVLILLSLAPCADPGPCTTPWGTNIGKQNDPKLKIEKYHFEQGMTIKFWSLILYFYYPTSVNASLSSLDGVINAGENTSGSCHGKVTA